MIKKINVLFLIFVSCTLCETYNAQEGENPKFSDKIYVGGNLGLSFGNITYIEISPLIGYKITEKYSAGLSFTYQYYKDKVFDVSGNVIGGSLFNRFNVTDELFLFGEYQVLSYGALRSTSSENTNPRNTIPYMWLGGGYQYRLGGRASIFAIILYDVIQDLNGRIQNPQIRGGITVGI